MNKAYCYVPQAIDKKLSEVISKNPHAVGWTPSFIASLRGAYDVAHGFSVEGAEKTNPMWSLDINTEDYEGDSEQADNFWNIVETLTTFRNEEKKKQADAITNFNENKTEIWTTISEYYPDLNDFYGRAAQLSHYFIQAIDNYIAQQQQAGNLITRQQVINGIPLTDENNKAVVGEDGKPIMAVNSDKIFSAVFNQFMADYSIRMNEVHSQEAYDHYQKEFEKIFNPKVWAALLITAKAQLKHMEGLKVSLTDNSASDIDISTLNDNDLADLFDPENSVREGWQVITDCQSAYGNLSMEVRKALSNIYVITTEKDGSSKILTDDLGYPVRMNSVTAYQNLMDLLRNCRSKSKMMKLIANNNKFQGLSKELKNNEVLQTQLYNNFRKVFQPYVQIQFEWNKIKHYVLNKTRAGQSIGNYLFGIKYKPPMGSIAYTSRFHWTSADIETLRLVLNAFVDKKDAGGKIVDSIWKKSMQEQKVALVQAFNTLGILWSDKALDTLVSNKKNLSEVIKNLSNLAQYSGLKDLKADTKDNFNSWLTKKTVEQEKGDTQKRIETIITKLEESGNGIVYESKCRTVNGKNQNVTYYGDVQPNFMGDLLGKIQSFAEINSASDKEAAREEFKEWLKTKYLSSTQFCDKFDPQGNPVSTGIKNFWLRTLWEEANNPEGKGSMFDDGSFTSQFQFMRVVTGKYEDRIIPFENFTTRQHFQQVVSSYFALDTQSNQKMSDFVYAPVFVLGDSGVCKVIKVKRKSTFQDYKNGKFDGTSIVDELYNIYESELRRMLLFKDFIAQNNKNKVLNNSNIEANANKFTMLTFLNEAFEGRDFTKLGVQEVKNAINAYLEKGFNNFLKVGENVGILGNKNEENRFSDLLKIKDPNNVEKDKTVKLNERLKEFYYNTYLSNILQYQVFTGDLGFYKNVKDFQKRYKEVHAPGNVLDVDATWNGEEVVKKNAQGIKAQKTMYFKDIHVDTEESNQEMMEVLLRVHATNIDEANKAIAEGITKPKEGQAEIDRQKKLQKLLGSKYGIYQKFVKDTSQTDGQGLRHIDSFRKLMIMAGLWNDRKEALHKEISDINERVIRENRNITPQELERISAYYTTIMPLKPYMFTMEKVGITGENGRNDNIFIPVQHKYAEAILIPCLLPVDSKLRQVAEFMGSKGIDLLCADTVVKVGMWGQTDLEEVDGKGNVDIKNNLSKAKIHELDYADYRIQSNVPEHINVQRALGTQVRKLIMGNIDMFSSKVYDYLGGQKFKLTKDGTEVELTGRNLVSLYTSLIVANMMESFEKFKKNVENEKKLSNLLTSAIVNNDRYSLHQLLDIAVNDGKFATPLYEGSIEHDTTAMIFSIFRKEVNKQDMKGGSAVQVSDWGITTKDEVSGEDRPLKFVTDEKNGNVLYAEIEIPFNFSYTDSNGNEVKLRFNDYCNTDGTFKTDEQGNTLIEKDFPGMLDIVAYRIPSERDYSMLNCKVVRCTEMTAGGTIRVPAQGTTIAGFDFDIDKLYLIRKDFVKRKVDVTAKYTDTEKAEIFWRIYSNTINKTSATDFLAKALSEGRTSLEELQDSYFDEENSSTIYKELKKIQEEHVAKGDKKLALNKYWDEMIERNPFMEDEAEYDKNKLFEQAAKELGLWKEQEYEEHLIEYDFNKAVSQNNRVARNNLVFELMRHRLMDKETLRDRLTPGGFDNARSAANYLKKLLGINEEQDAADPSTLLFYNQLNQVAAKLIGIFANQNTNHQLSSIVKQLDLTESIVFDGMIGAKLLKSTESLVGKSKDDLVSKIGKSLLSKEIQLSDGTIVDIDLNLAEFLAASVDAVKDPVLNYLNFNTTTASTGALLARMGYATKDIGVLFNQPIIREVCDIIQNSGGITTFASAKSKVLRNYTKDINEYKNANTSITTESFANQIIKYRDAVNNASDTNKALTTLRGVEDFRKSQLSALKIFEKAYNASRELNRFISTTKFTASNAVGSTIGFFYNQQYVVNDYINQTENALKMVIYESLKAGEEAGQKSLDIHTPRELLSDREGYIKSQIENPFAFEQCMYDLNKELLEVLGKYYPYDKAIYKDRRNILNEFLPATNVLDAETIDNIHRETSQHLLTNTDSAFNPNGIYEGNEEYTNRDYYLYRFPIEAFNLMKQGKLSPIITKYLGFSYSDYKDRNTGKIVRQLHIAINLSVEQSDKNTFTDAWAQLAISGKSDAEVIAETKLEFIKRYIRLHFTTLMDSTLKNLAYAKEERYTALNEKYKKLKSGLKEFLKNVISDDAVFINEDSVNKTNVDKIVLPTEEQSKLESEIERALTEEHKQIKLNRDIAKGLFFHNYYKTGFGVGPYSFIQFTPLEVKNLLEVGRGDNKMPYLDYISIDNLDKLAVVATNGRTPRSIMEFGYMYALNHPDNYKLVHRMPSEGNVRYASYFVDSEKRMLRDSFEIDLSSNSSDATRANAEFLISQDKETGDFKVYPVIMRNKAVYVAMIDGEYNFTGNLNNGLGSKVTYVKVPILGTKNVSSIYAATLNEAIGIRNQSAEKLAKIEEELSKEDQAEIEKYANTETQEKKVDTDELLNGEAEKTFFEGISENEGTSESEETAGDEAVEIPFTEEDVDTLAERLTNCNKITEDFLLEYLFSSLNEQQTNMEYDLDESIPLAKKAIAAKADEILKNVPENLRPALSDVTRKKLIIEDLVATLKDNIRSGKVKVYTNLTNEEIC